MIPSQHLLLLLCFARSSIICANIIQVNTLRFDHHQNPPTITMHPTLKLRNPTFSGSTTMPPSTRLLQQNPSCNAVGQAIAICNSLTPGFNTLQPTAQAHCLCYSGTSWKPTIFDNAVKTCADYASTAVPGAYQPLASLEGFCQGIQSSGMSESMGMSAVSGQPCNAVNSMLNDCSSSFNGFWSMQPRDRAKCLCYVGTNSWCPTAFDNAVQTCEEYAITVSSSVYAAVSGLGGFCAGVGDVLATPTPPASYSMATMSSGIDSPTRTSDLKLTKSSSYGNEGGTSTTHIETTITVGGARSAQTTESGGVNLERMNEGQVVAFGFLCALLVLFL
jgi:hypothetical protein